MNPLVDAWATLDAAATEPATPESAEQAAEPVVETVPPGPDPVVAPPDPGSTVAFVPPEPVSDVTVTPAAPAAPPEPAPVDPAVAAVDAAIAAAVKTVQGRPELPYHGTGTCWLTGINNFRAVEDIFAKCEAIKGDLSDEDAKASLAEFMFHNPAFLMDILGGIKMFPMQEIVLKGWARNDYNLMVAGRGLGKSFLVAIFALYWAIFNPKCRIVIASFSFRQSRAILDLCVKLIKDNGAERLHACFPEDMRRGTDEWRLEVPNGATIRCLPLGDGKKIRGVRADVLIIDEFAFLPETIIGEILRPFLASKNKIKEQRAIDERESLLIAQGEMAESERTILDDRKKVIFLSSACWTFEHMYTRYKDWTDLLTLDPVVQKEKYDEFKESGRGYFISRISWEAAPAGLLDLQEIAQARRELSEAMFNREYGAQFTSDSDGYFRASRMAACTVEDGESPCLELAGDSNSKDEYVLGIDQCVSGSEGSDHFAMCLMKIVTRQTDGKRLGMVVHSYAVAGGNLPDHSLYLFYLMTRFNIVYIALDASQGSELEFVTTCNQNPLFVNKGIALLPIDADFNKLDLKELVTDIKRGYNRQTGRIVQKQRFSSDWQRPANEYLQACFDHKNIRFAGKIASNPVAAATAMNTDITMLGRHEDFNDMSVSEFMSHQDFLVDLTKKECAMIQVKTTDLGTMSFGLPMNLRRTTGANKVRKDSYSALLIANWGVKLYVESQAVQVHTGPVEFPYAMVG